MTPTERETPLTKQILVSVDRAETRVAIMEDGRAAEVYIERRGQRSVVGHVWKGRVENVLAGHGGGLHRGRPGEERVPPRR